MGFSVTPGMTLEQMLKVMGTAEPEPEPAVEPVPDAAPAKHARKRPAAPEPES